jgi:stalled ribosome alternative rescue factor ArfA
MNTMADNPVFQCFVCRDNLNKGKGGFQDQADADGRTNWGQNLAAACYEEYI